MGEFGSGSGCQMVEDTYLPTQITQFSEFQWMWDLEQSFGYQMNKQTLGVEDVNEKRRHSYFMHLHHYVDYLLLIRLMKLERKTVMERMNIPSQNRKCLHFVQKKYFIP